MIPSLRKLSEKISLEDRLSKLTDKEIEEQKFIYNDEVHLLAYSLDEYTEMQEQDEHPVVWLDKEKLYTMRKEEK